jgi:hypothetical protein
MARLLEGAGALEQRQREGEAEDRGGDDREIPQAGPPPFRRRLGAKGGLGHPKRIGEMSSCVFAELGV